MRRYAALASMGIGALLISLLGCSSTPSPDGSDTSEVGGTLVMYTMNEEGMVNALIPAFEEATGVTVELTTAGTGELLQRIRSEAANPQADVLFGGGQAQMTSNLDLWAEYVSPNDASMFPQSRNTTGFITPFESDGSVLLVNTELTQKLGIEINGYKDLLQPELKGKIAFGDPSQSSSAFAHLTNMLLAVGGDYESEAAWGFVADLLDQLDGVTIGSSSQVAQDVANGELVVGLSYEPLSLNYVNSGAPVKIVYMEEGTVFLNGVIQIVKGAHNMPAAQAFVDFMTSEAGQTILAEQTPGRPTRDDVEKPGVVPFADIHTLVEDDMWVSENRDEIVARYQSLLAAH